MNSDFSKRLAALRKEKKLSQKTAAEALNVSQALLSHYEKGIRECGLDFLIRACNYYDVSADYLLGISDKRRNIHTGLNSDALPGESDEITEALHRAAIRVCERAGMSNKEMEHCFNRISTLSAYKTVLMLADKNPVDREWLTLAMETENLMSACIMHHRQSPFKTEAEGEHLFSKKTEALQALAATCEEYIKYNFNPPAKKKKSAD